MSSSRWRAVLAKARQRALTLILPVDVVIADHLSVDAFFKIVSVDQIPPGWRILDIGPQTIAAFREALLDAQTVIWNGTLGVAEMAPFDRGTQALISALVERTQQGATTIPNATLHPWLKTELKAVLQEWVREHPVVPMDEARPPLARWKPGWDIRHVAFILPFA